MTTIAANDDSTFRPDPPRKVHFYQVAILFAYHILLALFLAYAIYNVWPPQPWPGDSPRKKAETEEAGKGGSQTSSKAQNLNASSATPAPANPRTVANSNLAANVNAASTNQNTAATGSEPNVDSTPTPPAGNAVEAPEQSTSIYGGELPPAIWLFGQKFQPTLEVRLLLLVLLAGAIGSYIHASSSFVDYLGNRALISSWVWWYLLRPFIGMMLALLFYFVFRGGFITAGVNAGGDAAASFINPFGIAALAGLVGMFSKVAADKLNEVFLTLFAPRAGQGDAKRGDKLIATTAPVITQISPNAGPAAGGTPVTITGRDFLDGAAVNFGGVASPLVKFEEGTRLSVATPPHAPGVVDVEVINANNLKGNLKQGFTYQTGASPSDEGVVETAGDAAVDELDGHDVALKAETADEDLPLTEGGVE